MTAYYNEIDPYAAQWLRNLVAGGHIAPGDVDERDIRDISPEDLRGYTQCHFFAGVGVWSRALRQAGWPDDRSVWTGSCPCQPFSAAGAGEGFADERHLWPHFHHLIGQCRPAVVFGEQVAAKNADPWIDLVHADLEAVGYAFGCIPFPAAGIGAPHIRDRNYWVAYRDGEQWDRGGDAGQGGRIESSIRRSVSGLSDPNRGERDWIAGCQRCVTDWSSSGRIESDGGAASGCEAGRMGHHHHQGLEGQRWHGDNRGEPGRVDQVALRPSGASSESSRLPDTPSSGRREERPLGGGRGSGNHAERDSARYSSSSSLGGLVDADGGNASAEGLQRSGQHGLGSEDSSTVRSPTGGLGDNDGPGLVWTGPTNGHWRDADWLLCRDGKWRPVEPGTFPLAHGAASRVGRLRAYGNAIVAQAAEAFISVYLEHEAEAAALPSGVIGHNGGPAFDAMDLIG